MTEVWTSLDLILFTIFKQNHMEDYLLIFREYYSLIFLTNSFKWLLSKKGKKVCALVKDLHHYVM